MPAADDPSQAFVSASDHSTLLHQVLMRLGRRLPIAGHDVHGETAAAAAALCPMLADLMLLGRGAWSGRGKWLPRLLLQLDGNLAIAFGD